LKEKGAAATAAELKTKSCNREVINRYEIITKDQINDKVKKA
jgi:hypothetical protein